METNKVTRVEVIDSKREYVNTRIEEGSVTLSLQDDWRTLKIFVKTDLPANNTDDTKMTV